jgi:predicted SprT family Zn-dependent metalloprotease
MIQRKRTYKDITDERILEIWEEVKAEAKSIYPHFFEQCEPELYQDSSYSHLGLCRQSYSNPRERVVDRIKQTRCIITISSNLGQDYEQIRKTLCHELGHFVAPKNHHDHIWKVRANKIGERWNFKAERLTNNETFNKAAKEIRAQRSNDYKYAVYCPECGNEWKYKTKCQIVKSPGRYICSSCKTSLKVKTI